MARLLPAPARWKLVVAPAAALALGLAAGGCGSSATADRIVFSAVSPQTGRHVYAIAADGTHLVQVTRAEGDSEPSWSPDGEQIVFKRWNRTACDRPAHDCARIWVANADGTGLRPLTPKEHRSEQPDWSPHGDRIAFNRWADDANPFANQTHLYAIDTDGSNERLLTAAPGRDERATWSADGKQIAFLSDRKGLYDIYAIPADGGRVRRLTRTVEPEFSPSWSPDGKRIVFQDAKSNLVVMNANGSGKHAITSTGADSDPVWSPDGKQIAFVRRRSDRAGLYVIRSDGSDLRRIDIGRLFVPRDPDWA